MTTMLIVEDDPAWRALYHMELGQQFQLFEAADGQQALSMLDSVKPDIILLDLNLPRMNGVDFLRALDLQGSRTPVIVCSGMLPEDAPGRFLGIRIAQKSADLRDLRTAIREALGSPWGPPGPPVAGHRADEPQWLD